MIHFLLAEQAASSGGGFPIDVTALGVAAIGAVGGFLSYRNSAIARREQARLDKTKVDAEAYERARVIDQGVIDNLRSEITRLREELSAAEKTEQTLRRQLHELRRLEFEVHTLRVNLEEERGVSDRLRNQVAALERRVAVLIERLVDLGHNENIDFDAVMFEDLDRRKEDNGPPNGVIERRLDHDPLPAWEREEGREEDD